MYAIRSYYDPPDDFVHSPRPFASAFLIGTDVGKKHLFESLMLCLPCFHILIPALILAHDLKLFGNPGGLELSHGAGLMSIRVRDCDRNCNAGIPVVAFQSYNFV